MICQCQEILPGFPRLLKLFPFVLYNVNDFFCPQPLIVKQIKDFQEILY